MNYQGKNVVVSGGAGAIGSRLVKRLLDAGAGRVFVVDDLSSGFEWLLPGYERIYVAGKDAAKFRLDPRVVFLRRDVSAPNFMEGVPFGVEAFFHLAAHFANQNSVEQPFEDLRGNALGTLRALEAAARNRAKKFVFASCGCGVGKQDTPYQIHKRLGESYCDYFADRVPTVVCRFHNSFGPGEVPGRYRNVVPNFLWAAMADRPLTVFGDGSDVRDFVFVDDLVEFLVSATFPADAGVPRAAVYEIGTGVRTKITDLAEAIVELTKSKSEIVSGLPRRRWDHPGRAAGRASGRFVPLREGLERTYRWMIDNVREIRGSIRI